MFIMLKQNETRSLKVTKIPRGESLGALFG
jgi:hypothetical protein